MPQIETVQTRARAEMVDITPRLLQAIERKKLVNGLAVIFVAHTTAGVTINENSDETVKSDLLEKLTRMVPQNESYYQHDEGNSDAHLMASLMGHSVTVLVENGRPMLGRWQAIYLCEFDGPRERRVLIKLVPHAV